MSRPLRQDLAVCTWRTRRYLLFSTWQCPVTIKAPMLHCSTPESRSALCQNGSLRSSFIAPSPRLLVQGGGWEIEGRSLYSSYLFPGTDVQKSSCETPTPQPSVTQLDMKLLQIVSHGKSHGRGAVQTQPAPEAWFTLSWNIYCTDDLWRNFCSLKKKILNVLRYPLYSINIFEALSSK